MELKYWTSGRVWWSWHRTGVRVPPLLEKQEKSSSINCRQVVLACVHSVLEENKSSAQYTSPAIVVCRGVDSPYREKNEANHNIGEQDFVEQCLGVFWMESRSSEKKSQRESHQMACVIILWKIHDFVHGAFIFLLFRTAWGSCGCGPLLEFSKWQICT